MAEQPRTRRFTSDEYYSMGRTGILTEDDRVELINGEIIELPPIGDRHSACCSRLTRLLVGLLQSSAIVRVQDPVRLSPHSEPQPDIAVVQWQDDFYASGHPSPKAVLLLVEVADSSVAYDRGIKLPLYAAAAIGEVWLVDLQGNRVEMHRDPSASGYRTVEIRGRGQRVAAQTLPEFTLAVDDMLP